MAHKIEKTYVFSKLSRRAISWLKSKTKNKSIIDWLVLGVLLVFVVMCLPAIFKAYRTYAELWTYSSDEPHYLRALDELLLQGKMPSNTIGYGLFPHIAAAVIFGPILILIKLLGGQISLAHLAVAVRGTQVIFTAVSLLYIYWLTCLVAPPPWAFLAFLATVTMSPVFFFAIYIHPDAVQMTVSLIGIYYLAVALREHQVKYLLISAIFAGLASGSKDTGIFLIPAAALTYWSIFQDKPTATRSKLTIKGTVVYTTLHLVVMIIVNPQILFHLPSYWSFHIVHKTTTQFIGLNFSSGIWQDKLNLLTDDTMLGPLFTSVYLVALFYLTWQDIKAGAPSPITLINVVIMAFFAIFFPLWIDKSNIPGGHRYLIQFAALMSVVVAAFAYRLVQNQNYCWQVISLIALIPIFGFMTITRSNDLGIAFPRLSKYKQTIISLYQKEKDGRFLIKKWIKQNVQPGKSIYVEYYMNVALNQDWDPAYKELSHLKIFSDFFIKSEKVKEYRPDYVVIGDLGRAKSIMSLCPEYRLYASLGCSGPVYILNK